MKNQIAVVSTLSLILLVGLSTNKNFTNANALISGPASYDLSYKYESTYGAWGFRTQAGGFTSNLPTYTRTADTSGFQYNGSLNYDASGTPDESTAWPRGLDTLASFRVSNTTWTSFGTDYVPASATIGSNVNLNIQKIAFQFNNNTDHHYQVWFDSSTVTSSRVMSYNLNGVQIQSGNNAFVTLQSYIIPAGFNITIEYEPTNSSVYLDALYLKDLGIASTLDYQDGYDLGVDDGFEMGYDTGLEYGTRLGYEDGYYEGATDEGNNLIGATEIFRRTFTAMRPIFEITVFPGVTLGTLALFPLLGIVLMFFKKVIQ